GDRFRHEARAVGFGAGNRGEKPVPLHLSTVGSDAGNLGLAAWRGGRHLRPEQALELHGASARFLLGGNRPPPARNGFLLVPRWGVKRACKPRWRFRRLQIGQGSAWDRSVDEPVNRTRRHGSAPLAVPFSSRKWPRPGGGRQTGPQAARRV